MASLRVVACVVIVGEQVHEVHVSGRAKEEQNAVTVNCRIN